MTRITRLTLSKVMNSWDNKVESYKDKFKKKTLLKYKFFKDPLDKILGTVIDYPIKKKKKKKLGNNLELFKKS